MRETEGLGHEGWGLKGKVLLVGAGGMLGRAWRELLTRQGVGFDAPGRDSLDLLRPGLVREVVSRGYGVVVNCSGYTDVDGVEREEAHATAVNGVGVGALAACCAKTGATLIHYSTDYVFNGRAAQPYAVHAPIEPLNAYGRSKAAGERAVMESGGRHLLIRTSWLYAPWGRNFVRTIVELAHTRDSIRVVNDQEGRPTSCEQLAAVSFELLNKKLAGTWHVTDGGRCTWYELAGEVVRLAGISCRVEPCTTHEYPRPAPRPAYSVLDIAATEAEVGPLRDWKENLASVMAALGGRA